MTTRFRSIASAVMLAGVVLTGCTAAPTGPTASTVPPPPPASTVVLQPAVATGGEYIQVIAPDNTCARGDYNYLSATLTMRSGIVLAYGYSYYDPWYDPWYGEQAPEKDRVWLRIPWALAGGKYYVHLSCSNYLDEYNFLPATLTVLPPSL